MPFCDPDFFKRFQEGESLLYLTFVERVEPVPLIRNGQPLGTDGAHLEMREAVGVYLGTDGGKVILWTGARDLRIATGVLRGLKKLEAAAFFEMLQPLFQALCLPFRLDPAKWQDRATAVRLANAFRGANKEHA